MKRNFQIQNITTARDKPEELWKLSPFEYDKHPWVHLL